MNYSLDIKSIFIRDLNNLKQELRAYNNQELLWESLPGTANSGGNLALHLIGNLRHFIGSIMGSSGYVRDRDIEFSKTGVSLMELEQLIDDCLEEISIAFDSIDAELMQKKFPIALGKVEGNTFHILLHLLSHFNYHLGQINYHRRLICSIY